MSFDPPIPMLTCACEGCNNTFPDTVDHKIYCSMRCREHAGRIRRQKAKMDALGPVTCLVCGKQVQRSRTKQTTCLDPECCEAWEKNLRHGFGNEEPSKSSVETNWTIDKTRSELGMRPLKPGYVRCLRCDQRFESSDILTERICGQCAIHNRAIFRGSLGVGI